MGENWDVLKSPQCVNAVVATNAPFASLTTLLHGKCQRMSEHKKNTTQLWVVLLISGLLCVFHQKLQSCCKSFRKSSGNLDFRAFQQKRQIMPWQMKSTFIIVIVCSFLLGNTQFCGYFWGYD